MAEVILLDGVETIEESAFSGCTELKSITIPGTVKEIGEHTFGECINLKDIYFESCKSDWDIIKKSAYWDNNCNKGEYIVHCIDGDIKKYTKAI